HRAAASVYTRQERLAKNSFEHHRELRANLRLLVRWENVNNTVDGRSGAVRVQSGERQVAGFRDTQGGFNGLEVAHFADEHHVGVFAQGSAERIRKGVRVRVNFALIDEAFLVVVQKFDRVFDRNHVLFALGVDLVEHGGERRGLTGTCWSRDQDKSA